MSVHASRISEVDKKHKIDAINKTVLYTNGEVDEVKTREWRKVELNKLKKSRKRKFSKQRYKDRFRKFK